MQLGMIGLGRMGANMARRLMRGGHQCVVYDRSPDTVKALAAEGAKGSDSLAALVAGLAKPLLDPQGFGREECASLAARHAIHSAFHRRGIAKD